MTIFVILPAYNESKNLLSLLEKFTALNEVWHTNRSYSCKIVLVDDGSTDETSSVAESFKNRLDIAVEKHLKNLGLGEALRSGFRKVISLFQAEDLVVTMDADNSHSPDLIPEMAKKIQEGADVVIASRYAVGGRELGLPKSRKFLSAACNKLLRCLFPLANVSDYTCGYRMMRASLLEKLSEKTGNIFFNETGFVCTSELLLNLNRCGGRFAEVSLVLHYDWKKGKSKMKIFQTIFRYFIFIVRFRASLAA